MYTILCLYVCVCEEVHENLSPVIMGKLGHWLGPAHSHNCYSYAHGMQSQARNRPIYVMLNEHSSDFLLRAAFKPRTGNTYYPK